MNQRERRYKDPKLNAAADELWSYRQRQFEIKRIKAKTEEYRDRYSVGAVCFDGVRVNGGVRHDKLVETAVIWADLETELKHMIAEAEKSLWEIYAKLNKLRLTYQQVLELYYIKGYSVMKIAEMMDYSEQWVRLTKFNALKEYAYVTEQG